MTFLGGNILSQVGSDLGSTALNSAAEAAANTKAVAVNRARIAALVNLGYSSADAYQAAKPSLFIAGIIGTIISSMALAKRRKNPEAVTLYSLTAAASIATAWFTRPAMLAGAPPTPAESNPNAPGVVKSTLGWADARVAKLTARDPGWESRTLARLWGDIGSGTMAPAVQTLLTKNAH